MHKNFLVNIAIALSLVIALAAAFPVTGYLELRTAEAAEAGMDYQTAAGSYARAAKLIPWRKDLWEKSGEMYSIDRQYQNSIFSYQKAVQFNALTGENWYSFGLAYWLTKDPAAALNIWRQGALANPTIPSLQKALAMAYQEQKNYVAERESLEQWVILEPGNAEAHYKLGLLLALLEPELAIRHLKLASSISPEYDPAVHTLLAALDGASIQSDHSQRLVTIGRALGLLQQWELSLAAFEKAIQINARNAEAWAWLGEARQQIDQDGSVELDRALSLDHESVIVRALRGLYWNRQKKYKQMLAEYLLAAEYEPANPAWRVEAGNAYVKLGDLASALTAYQRAVELAPDDSTYWRLLAIFCAENGAHLEDVGLPAAQKAVDLAPKDPSALDALGYSYFSSGRYANAEQNLNAALVLDPEYFPAHIHLAMNYLAQGNRAFAFDQLIYVRDTDTSGVYNEIANQLLKQYFP